MVNIYPRRSVQTAHLRLRNNQDLVDEWHVFGLLWTPNFYSFYLDGQQHNFRQKWDTSMGVSKHREYLILSLNAGDAGPNESLENWHGQAPSQGFGSKAAPTVGAIIDYVQWWQNDELDAEQRGVVPGPHLPYPAGTPACKFE